MSKIVDLDQEREISAMIHELGSLMNSDSSCSERTVDYLEGRNMPKHSDGSTTVSVRFPSNLLVWLDQYARRIAFERNVRMTRNSAIVSFLEFGKAMVELQESGKMDDADAAYQIALDLVKKQNATMKE